MHGGKCNRWDPDDWGRIPIGSKKEGKGCIREDARGKHARGRMHRGRMREARMLE
jgi:hypothetical protein